MVLVLLGCSVVVVVVVVVVAAVVLVVSLVVLLVLLLLLLVVVLVVVLVVMKVVVVWCGVVVAVEVRTRTTYSSKHKRYKAAHCVLTIINVCREPVHPGPLPIIVPIA